MSRGLSFAALLDGLEKHHGRPPALPVTTALGLVLWENVAYLASDKKRAQAFAMLKERVGTAPESILAASREDLFAVAELGGMHPERRVSTLITIAETVMEEFDGNLEACLELPLSSAKRALKKFPRIGDPGAEKILLFTETRPILALESNGLRVLLRFGFGEEQKDYAASYRSVRAALEGQLPDDCKKLIRAHQLLRLHGKELCKNTRPACEACPVRARCRFASH